MTNKDESKAQKVHVLVLPYPYQGHINPMLQFSKRLASKNIKPTLVLTNYVSRTMFTTPDPNPTIRTRTISDGFDQMGRAQAESTEAYLASLWTHGSRTLGHLVETLAQEGDPVKAIIYDGFFPWALEVARRYGLIGALFFTQSCAVNSVYYHVQRGLIRLPLCAPVVVPGVPELRPYETPSFLCKYGSHPYWFDVVLGQFSNIDQADWVLCNIFYEMEKEVVDWMATKWRVRPIGPTVPSYYLDNRLENDKDYTLQLFKSEANLCKQWLDTKSRGSVVYVSFGSASDPSKEQFDEMAYGLRNSGHNFLWVVRDAHRHMLHLGYIDEVTSIGLGLVVGWASQLEILAHEAIGCFVTHCGFNSILEVMSLGVPVVAVPQWTDQGTNAKYVEDVWKVGVRARVGDDGVVGREELMKCFCSVMRGVEREEFLKNASKWKRLAREAVDEGGNSDRNIDEFVSFLMQC